MLAKKSLVVSALAAATMFTSAVAASAHEYVYHHGAQRHVIVVSCFRGPWNDVIWDHPEAVFVDSLVNLGYTFPEAHAIAERVCRDSTTVGQPEEMKAAMYRILAANPPGS